MRFSGPGWAICWRSRSWDRSCAACPPAGAVALLGGLLKARMGFVLVLILSGSLLLVGLAVLFKRLRNPLVAYPHHWL